VATQVQGQSPHSEYFYEFGDAQGEKHFLLWHHLRHHSYDLIMSKRGVALPPLDLKGEVDADWLKRHRDRHSTLRRIAGGTGDSLVGLVTVRWHDEQQHFDWLRIHSIDHAKLDAYFGL
jgi:hypothetical protein